MVHADRYQVAAMRVLTASEMQAIDRETAEVYGLSSRLLMERAGVAATNRILSWYPDSQVFVVLCGPGNNGGDGLVVARELKNRGYSTIVYLFVNHNRLRGDALLNYQILERYGAQIKDAVGLTEDLPVLKLHNAVVIDALFGTGLTRDIEGAYAEAIDSVNRLNMPVVSIDIPSGVCSDTGRILGTAIKADYTVTFGLPKIGHFIHPGAAYTGKLSVQDIGFPKVLTKRAGRAQLIDHDLISGMVPLRPQVSNKHDYGHVLLVAGSRGKTGAALMAAKAALRTGCGLLTIAMPASVLESLQCSVLEEMTLPLTEDSNGMVTRNALEDILDFANKRATVIAIGPGLGLSDDVVDLTQGLLKTSPVPLVVDADGINALSKTDPVKALNEASCKVVITPHEGEMARLMRSEKMFDRVKAAREFASASGAVTLLKGVPTLVAIKEGNLFINTTGNPGMATGGSGDVLTGIIASLIGQRLSPLDAALLGAYIHGLAGDIAATERGLHSLIASDIINALPKAFIEVCKIHKA